MFSPRYARDVSLEFGDRRRVVQSRRVPLSRLRRRNPRQAYFKIQRLFEFLERHVSVGAEQNRRFHHVPAVRGYDFLARASHQILPVDPQGSLVQLFNNTRIDYR